MAKILYVGGFILPDKNAAAQRVVSLAKGFRDLGHEVIFLNYASNAIFTQWVNYFDFKCYECPKQTMFSHLFNIKEASYLIKNNNFDYVIAYNYPSLPLYKMIKLCRKNKIKIFADVTEWYVAKGNVIFRLFKTVDTELRMRVLHKKVDRIIAISQFLYEYYMPSLKTIKVPATVDIEEHKWLPIFKKNSSKTIFVYAGQPDAQKEKLDVIVYAIETLKKTKNVEFHVIGITKEQFEKIYSIKYCLNATMFYGRISHEDAIKHIKLANWSIVIRENNKVVKAGFPTKVAESISCGTPVIANEFSNISDYLDSSNSILCGSASIEAAIHMAASKGSLDIDNKLFDYRKYLDLLKELFE